MNTELSIDPLLNSSLAPNRLALRLGYAGLIPFVALAIAVWWGATAQRTFFGFALLAYASSIASFLGAIHWGLAMRSPSNPTASNNTAQAWGVVPSLVVWIALLINPQAGLIVLAALLWACYAVDRKIYAAYAVQAWLPLRLPLTTVSIMSCLAGAGRLLIR